MSNIFHRLVLQVLEDNSCSGAFGPSAYSNSANLASSATDGVDLKVSMSIAGGSTGGKSKGKKKPKTFKRRLPKEL